MAIDVEDYKDEEGQDHLLEAVCHITKLPPIDFYKALAIHKLPHPSNVHFLHNATLVFAIVHQNVALVFELVSKFWGSNIQSRNKRRTSLHVAAQYGSAEIVKILLENHADQTARDSQDCWPFHIAAQNGQADLLKLLLPSQLIQRAFGQPIDATIVGQLTALHLACAGAHVAAVQQLCQLGASTTAVDRVLATPLCRAIVGGIESPPGLHHRSKLAIAECVRCLLHYGAPVEGLEGESTTPLMLAVQRDIVQAVSCLLQAGASIRMRSGTFDPVTHALLNNQDTMAKQLLLHGEEHLEDFRRIVQQLVLPDGRTWLHLAAATLNLEGIIILGRLGAAVDAADSMGQTPLHVVLRSRTLFGKNHTSDAMEVDAEDQTKVRGINKIKEIKQLRISCMEQLLRLNANMGLLDCWGQSPFHIIAEWHGPDELEALSKAPNRGKGLHAVLTKKDLQGKTPLHIASDFHKFDLLQAFYDGLLL